MSAGRAGWKPVIGSAAPTLRYPRLRDALRGPWAFFAHRWPRRPVPRENQNARSRLYRPTLKFFSQGAKTIAQK